MTDPVTVWCPNCRAEVEDNDGFGVLDHDLCGYCTHPDVYGGVCTLCRVRVEGTDD